MRILDKYIIKNFLASFLYCLILFIFLYIIIDLFGHLDEILKHRTPISILQQYYLSMVPFIILHTAPIAALISTIYTMGTMNKHDEITAMRAAGINIFRILSPFIFIGLVISIIVFLISEKLLPFSIKTATSIKENYIEKESEESDKTKARATIDAIALYGKNDRLIFIESYDTHNKIATGITILQQDKDGNVRKKLNATEGKWTGESWGFSDVLIYKLDENGAMIGNPFFYKEMDIDIETPKELISKGAYYEFMDFKNLSSYIRNFANTSPRIINRLKVDLHQKISFPFTSLIIILISSSFAMKIKRRGKSAAIMGIGMSMVIGFVYYVLMATFIALGKGGLLPPVLSAHLANIIFGTIGIVLVRN